MNRRNVIATLGVLIALNSWALPAKAQAWVPAQGDGSVSLIVSDIYSKYHYLPVDPIDLGHLRSYTGVLDLTYGLTDRMTVSVSLPLVVTKYMGDAPHPQPLFPGVNPLDDGSFHATFQDFRFSVRYNVAKKRGFALTPFIGSVVPSHDYEIFAHAAPGRDLNEMNLGVSAAKVFERWLPGVFIQATYSYGIVQQILDIPHNHSNVSVEGGYFLTPKLRVLAIGSGQRTHGGIDAHLETGFDPILFPVHDQITRDNYFNAGGGIAYALTDGVDLFASMIHGLQFAQRNAQQVHTGLTIGLSWGFSTRHAGDRAIASAEKSLTRCVCEKGTR